MLPAAATLEARGLDAALRFLLGQWRFVAVVLMLLVAGGETYFRLPFILQRLEYQPDPEIGGVLRPSQRGYVWLANMSLQSPPITLNRDGHRGAETDWSHPVVLVLGDSEWFGAGVEDGQVWTALLQTDLRRELGREHVQVVNASHPGFGPAHQALVLRRLVPAHHVDLVLVRVAIDQSNFRLPAPADRPREFAAAQHRQMLRRITKFGPYLFDKALAQRDSLVVALVPLFLREARSVNAASPEAHARAMWLEMQPSWRDLAENAITQGIPLVFVVHDIEGGPTGGVLLAELSSLIRVYSGLHLMRIDGAALGLGDLTAADRARIFRETLTLGRDLHANAHQHRLIADAILRELRGAGLTIPLQRDREFARDRTPSQFHQDDKRGPALRAARAGCGPRGSGCPGAVLPELGRF
jgi:lysophospholipase L1-like esterase